PPPTLPVDAEHARPRAERAHSGQQLRGDVFAGVEERDRLGSGGHGGRDQVLALGDEEALARARLPGAQAADQLQLLVVRARNHLPATCYLLRPRKKGGSLLRPPREAEFAGASTPRWPPGQA